jgi:hypothetical protein
MNGCPKLMIYLPFWIPNLIRTANASELQELDSRPMSRLSLTECVLPIRVFTLLLRSAARNVFRKNADQHRFLPWCLVKLFGRYSLDKLAMRLKLSPQIPRPAIPTTSQVTKRGMADLALHNLLAIPHRELERHQIGIIPNSLTSRQRHEPGSFPMAR